MANKAPRLVSAAKAAPGVVALAMRGYEVEPNAAE